MKTLVMTILKKNRFRRINLVLKYTGIVASLASGIGAGYRNDAKNLISTNVYSTIV